MLSRLNGDTLHVWPSFDDIDHYFFERLNRFWIVQQIAVDLDGDDLMSLVVIGNAAPLITLPAEPTKSIGVITDHMGRSFAARGLSKASRFGETATPVLALVTQLVLGHIAAAIYLTTNNFAASSP